MGNIKVTIHDLSRGGSGVGKLESGAIIFVPFTTPGDEVEVKVIESKKKFSHGELVRILKPAPTRVKPSCSVFGKCGGCSWQHLSYSLQFETKKIGLFHALNRAGIQVKDLPFDELPAESEYGYRNRIQIRGNPATQEFGFYEKGSKKIVSIKSCPISHPKINAALPALAKEGFEKFDKEFKLEVEVSRDGVLQKAWNQGHAAFGFRQVNDQQNEKLKDWVQTHIRPAQLLLDLYGGYGNLSLPLVSAFEKVLCVDLFTPREHMELPPQFNFVRQDLHKWSERPLDADLQGLKTSVILDPPREGMSEIFPALQEKLKKVSIESLILVGCDVDSFVRDSQQLIKAGFRLERLAALDIFPQTPHLESLALFSK